MAEINLLKNELKEKNFLFFRGGQGLIMLYVVASIIAVELLLYGGLLYYQNTLKDKQRIAEQQVAEVDLEIGQIAEDLTDAIRTQRQISNLTTLVDQHVFWSNLFEELEKYTLTRVRFSSLEGNLTTSSLRITGRAFSYTDIAKLLAGLKLSPLIREANLLTSTLATAEESGYAFSIELSIDPKVFVRK